VAEIIPSEPDTGNADVGMVHDKPLYCYTLNNKGNKNEKILSGVAHCGNLLYGFSTNG
jgi:hypothetical protein